MFSRLETIPSVLLEAAPADPPSTSDFDETLRSSAEKESEKVQTEPLSPVKPNLNDVHVDRTLARICTRWVVDDQMSTQSSIKNQTTKARVFFFLNRNNHTP